MIEDGPVKTAFQHDGQFALRASPTISAHGTIWREKEFKKERRDRFSEFLKCRDYKPGYMIGWLSEASSWFFRGNVQSTLHAPPANRH
jgi:hypothetical protein